jgi:hypothetical protein
LVYRPIRYVELHWNLRKTTELWRKENCQDNLLPWLKAKSPICSDLLGLSWWERLLERIKGNFKGKKKDTSEKITLFQKYNANKQNISWEIRKFNNPFLVYSVVTSCTRTYFTYTKKNETVMLLQTVAKGKPVTGTKTKYIPSDSKLTSSVLVQGKGKLHAWHLVSIKSLY